MNVNNITEYNTIIRLKHRLYLYESFKFKVIT